jgi:alkane 1-monooxygenase
MTSTGTIGLKLGFLYKIFCIFKVPQFYCSMNSIKVFKYLSPLLVYVFAYVAFTYTGWVCFLPVIYGFVTIPLVELFLKPSEKNMSGVEEEMAKSNKTYDYILYLIVFLQVPFLMYFLYHMKVDALTLPDRIGRIASMGLLCGTFGINVGHELGHRIKPFEQWLAKLSLMTSLYMHFFIEHNKGHHKNVATLQDPSSSRYGEMLYLFWWRTVVFSYIGAWHIANAEVKKRAGNLFSWRNEMVQAHLIQTFFVTIIFFLFGGEVMGYFLLAALMGILLLETVNYIEHYGLSRQLIAGGKYERTMPQHSWNSNHAIGRLMLFELSRHSDHHYLASRKYQILRHHENAPQMPTGYPGMMLLSFVPPLWFWVMNDRVKKLKSGIEE